MRWIIEERVEYELQIRKKGFMYGVIVLVSTFENVSLKILEYVSVFSYAYHEKSLKTNVDEQMSVIAVKA